MVGIDETFKELNDIEKRFDELWDTYNPDESSTNLCILHYKLSTLGYEYVAKSYEIIRREKDDLLLKKIKNILTKISWITTGVGAFMAPPVFLGGIIGSSYLSVKKYCDKQCVDDIMNSDERDILVDMLTRFDSKCSNCVDTVADRFEYLDSDEALNEVKENNPQDYNRRLASKLIVDFLYGGRMEVPNTIKDDVISLVQKEFETEETDFEELMNIMYDKAASLGDENYRTSERARKLARQRKSKFYNY